MVEGHQCHRVAHAHRRLLVGRRFKATSPNGRFVDGARAIDGKQLSRIEVHGKNLFYFFDERKAEGQHSAEVVRIHFGMSGAFRTMALAAESERPPGPTTRLRLELLSDSAPEADSAPEVTGEDEGPSARGGSEAEATTAGGAGSEAAIAARALSEAAAAEEADEEEEEEEGGEDVGEVVAAPAGSKWVAGGGSGSGGLVAHLSAMTVLHGGMELYHENCAKLGPDPLREDADPELLWNKVQRCKKPVGLVLMDQSMMAGVGNIYRAEILFKAGVHPEQPAHSLSRDAFDVIWAHSVALLQRGFQTGSILTVDPEEAAVLGKPWTRRYIYNHSQCGRCKGPIKSWDMANRTVYCCPTCQPLLHGSEVAPQRRASMAAAKTAKEFVSHCAPDHDDAPPTKLTVPQLKARLSALELSTAGNKAALAARLAAAMEEKQEEEKKGTGTAIEEEEGGSKKKAAAPAAPKGRRGGKRAAAAAAAAAKVEIKEEEDGEEEEGGSEDGVDKAEQRLGAQLLGDSSAAAAEASPEKLPAPAAGKEVAAASGGRAKRRLPLAAPKPGTAGLGRIATAAEAAAEKLRAGESRAVEHVALADEDVDALIEERVGGCGGAAKRPRRTAAGGRR